MEVFEGHRALFRPLAAPAIALGNFDGVHRGHQRLLEETVRAARAQDGDAVVLTFDPHPAAVLAPHLAPPLITTRDRKLELLASHGINVCILEPFTRDLAGLSPEAFVDQVLVKTLGAKHVVVGFDFSFGKKRAGTTETLRIAGQTAGFTTQVIEAVTVEGIVASSTKVRNFIGSGNTAGARLLLGRDFELEGTVVRGEGRGRTIGIPTANIALADQLTPPNGVYAVRVHILDALGEPVAGVANLGTKPTFGGDGESTFEVHLLDFEGDLYGRPLRASFVERLRGERRFSGPEALVEQIHADIARARQALDTAAQ